MGKASAKRSRALAAPLRPNNPADIAPAIPLREPGIIALARVGALDARLVEAAFRFGNTFRQANEDARRGFQEYVDGRQSTPRAERQADAMGELRRCRQLVGQHGYRLLVSVAGEGFALGDLYPTRRQRDTAADLVRLHLNELAEMWRLAER